MKTFKLTYDENIVYEKIIEANTLEEAKEFIDGFFAGFPGLKDNFDNTKKQVLKRGWIELEQYTGKRYFFSKFEDLKSWYEKAMSLYPSDWKSWSKEAKKEWSKEEKEKNPLYGIYWKEYMGLKGSLERKGLNYRIQGSASTQSKIASILLEEKLGGLVNFVHDEAILILPYVSDENNKIIADIVKKCMIEGASYVTTNVPMDRLVTKINNASEALNSQNTAMQRIMVGLGWSPYSAGIEDSAGDKKIREEAKAKRKIEGVEKAF